MEFEVQGMFADGWEMVTGATSYADAVRGRAEYRTNDPGTEYRIWAEFGDTDADKRALEFFANMMSDGASYVDYWASVKWIGDSLEVTDDDDRSKKAVVEPAMLAVAHAKLARLEEMGRFHCCGQEAYVQGIQAAIMEGRDELDYDACTADACIQLAVLGEIAYG